jgi:hypothetical protein
MKTLPSPNTAVLAWDTVRWVRAIWVPKDTLSATEAMDDFGKYNEELDDWFCPEGWYELQSHGLDDCYWHIPTVTQWMPLPPKPEITQVEFLPSDDTEGGHI